MLRTSVGAAFVLGLLLATGGIASAAEMEGPLPFLAGQEPGCRAVASVVRPDATEAETWSAAADECTGCSVHNCFFQRVGTVCLVNGRRGLCTANPRICPEVKEVSCTCEVP